MAAHTAAGRCPVPTDICAKFRVTHRPGCPAVHLHLLGQAPRAHAGHVLPAPKVTEGRSVCSTHSLSVPPSHPHDPHGSGHVAGEKCPPRCGLAEASIASFSQQRSRVGTSKDMAGRQAGELRREGHAPGSHQLPGWLGCPARPPGLAFLTAAAPATEKASS